LSYSTGVSRRIKSISIRFDCLICDLLVTANTIILALSGKAVNLKQHETTDGMKVWLTESDTEQLLDAAETAEQRIAFALAVRCGLRSHEVLQVSPSDVVETDAGAC